MSHTMTTPLRLGGQPKVGRRPVGEPRLPDFLIIGACKAGTTTLWRYLQRHPRIFLLDPKEPDFFSRIERYDQGIGWYKTLFVGARPDQFCGEASTTYSRWPHLGDVPARIARAAPTMKLIYMMRHPVDRTYSDYCQRMRMPVPRLTFEEALQQDRMFTDTSLYMMQIEKFLERFPRELLLPILLDDLSDDPRPTLETVQRFLGLDPIDLVGQEVVVMNRATEGADDFVRQRLSKWIRLTPGVDALLRLAPSSLKDQTLILLTSSSFGRRVAKGYKPSLLLPETRQRLLKLFEEPNIQLAEFLGRDLSHWNA